jgi:2-polyprenyl-6-methoxyphenol hydroxylase-like FAD-dependent oxidoreductase
MSFRRRRSAIASSPVVRRRLQRTVCMADSADALVIGAGPAGTSTAIWLANAGWDTTLVEQHCYPRRKVCGECIAAGNLGLLDALGVGAAFRRMAGPQLERVGWMGADETVIAELPPCLEGPAFFGRALGRDRLDELLLQRAKALGQSTHGSRRAGAIRVRH